MVKSEVVDALVVTIEGLPLPPRWLVAAPGEDTIVPLRMAVKSTNG